MTLKTAELKSELWAAVSILMITSVCRKPVITSTRTHHTVSRKP